MADPQPADDLSTVLAPYLPLLGALRRRTPVDADRTSLVEADGPELAVGHRPSVLAGAIHRMTAYRAGEAGSTHDAIAGLYGVTPSETRAITPLLQARLQLTTTQPW
jgi:hypothetical protein